jgi:hypothetical protein
VPKRKSFEERAKLAAWFHGWKDDEWDEQMKRDVADGKLDLGVGKGSELPIDTLPSHCSKLGRAIERW